MKEEKMSLTTSNKLAVDEVIICEHLVFDCHPGTTN